MMTLTYAAGSAIYVNMTNRCPCACTFCLRHNKDHVFDSDSLWLDREPTVTEVCESLDSWDLSKYSEVVFCGYGEPTERLDDMLAICRYIREHSNISIRLNTNGQAELIWGKESTPKMKGMFDIVSISLNAADADTYDAVCHSRYGREAYDALLAYAEHVK